MWLLKGPKDENYYLVPGKDHVVGRKDSDLVFADDQSISRKHAVISVKHPIGNLDDPNKRPEISITESGSKYGTVINTENGAVNLQNNSTRTLSDAVSIHFGRQWNTWRLVYKPMIIVMSTLTGAQKKEVKDIIGKLGGHIVSTWRDDCTHLTMSSFTMTVKAIIALALGKAIVVPEFWKKFLTAIQNKTELPSYENFLPPLAETIINKNEVSFLIKPERSQLFQGKEFLFFTVQQHSEHACLVTAAGGSANILDLDKIPEKKLIEPHIIIMQHLTNPSCQVTQTQHSFTEVISFLQSHGKRVIPVSEIGLAILHCSTEKYCNPSFSFASTMLSSNRNTISNLESQQTLALETQEPIVDEKINRNIVKDKLIIPESGTVSKNTSNPIKKGDSQCTLHEDSAHSTEGQHARRVKVSHEPTSSSSSKTGNQKRPRSKESDDSSRDPPSKRIASLTLRNSNHAFKSTIDDDSEGLFDFDDDKIQNKLKDDNDEEDLFAFKEPLHIKKETADDGAEEDIFSFQTTSDDIQPSTSKMKRKFSSGEEDMISDRFSKKMALEDTPTHSNTDFEIESQQHEFLSVSKIKAERSTESMSASSSNSTIVVVKSLVTSQPITSLTKSPEGSIGQNMRNFKKFRKIQATNTSILPRIIGGGDMVPYSKNSSDVMRSLFNDDGDYLDEEKDEQDDWAFQPITQTKKKGQSRRL